MLGLIHGGDVTRTWSAVALPASGDAAPHNIGDEAYVANASGSGFLHYVFVSNTSGTAFVVGNIVEQIAAATPFEVKVSTAAAHPSKIRGVCQVAIADDECGWVLDEGVGVIKVDATGVTAEDLLVTAAAGVADVADDTAATSNNAHKVIAVAAATIAANLTGAAYICCR